MRIRIGKWLSPPLAALAGLALVEGGLAVCGLGTPTSRLDLRRGIDAREDFAPSDEDPGAWTLLESDGRAFQTLPPRRPGVFRVCLFGGSNVQGFPSKQLEQRLGQLDPGKTGKTWEVLNLGRNGYGSGRVLGLVSGALEHLDPDLLVIYSGHNEFVERGFLMGREEQWSSPWMAALGEQAQGLRTVNLLAQAFADERPPQETEGERWKQENRRFEHVTYEQTLKHLDEFEENLALATEIAREHGVAIVLCTVVFNHFSRPWISTFSSDSSDEEIAEVRSLLKRARDLYPESLRALVPENAAQRLHPADWRGCPLKEFNGPHGVLPTLRPVDSALAVWGMRAPGEACWSEKVRPFYTAVERFFAEPPSPELERAEGLLERAIELSPTYPTTLFEAGLVAHVLGRDPTKVAEYLDLAGDYDRAPRRASRAINDRVRRLAAEQDVPLFDAAALFRTRVPNGLVGWEVMRDQCHLHRGTRMALMTDMGDFLLALEPTR